MGMIDMEKKQLNLSAPLLSARRFSSPLRSSGEELKKDPLPERRNSFPAKKSGVNLDEVAKPGSVPFIWEKTPGRAKSGSKSQFHSPEEPANAPRLPPGRALDSLPRVSGLKSGELSFVRTQNKLSGELNVIRQPSKFLSMELAVLRSVQLDEDMNQRDKGSGSDSDAAAFSDAFDALESYSMNCSTSGLSSSELTITKPSGNSSTDVGNRDFMMHRFLPAAKAMTLESPQYASKRQIVAVEQPQLSKVIVPKIVKIPVHAPDKNMAITLYKGQDIGSEQSDDDEEERSHEPRNISVKSRGFFPWFCSNNALHLLNPVPIVKVKTKSALASASKVGKLVKNASYKSPSRTNSKHFLSTHQKRKLDPMTKSCELNRVESKPKSKSRPMFFSGELATRNGDLQTRNSLSPYRNYRRSVSPYRNEAPHSPVHNGTGYLIVPKRVDQPVDHRSKPNNRATNHQTKMQGSGSGSPVTKKTLYADSVNITKSHHSSGRMDLMNARGITKHSSFSKERSPVEGQIDHNFSKMNQSFHSSKVLGNGNVNSSKEIILRAEDPVKQSPLLPSLPKSPSESWLSRNLNAASPRNSVSHSHVGTKFQRRQQAAQATAIASTKWETIVKSSHLHRDYGLHSEELVARVPQQS